MEQLFIQSFQTIAHRKRRHTARMKMPTALALLPWLPWLPLMANAAPPEGDPTRGRALHVEGRLPDGQTLRARRTDLPDMTGTAAACAQCHRRSGLGDQEGRVRVPPITAASLFTPGQPTAVGRAAPGIDITGTRVEKRPAYTVETFARALRTGVDPAGRTLASWMPRYDLDDTAVADLLAWLQQLGPVGGSQVRGLDGLTLHIATVVTPDAPAARREAIDTTLTAWAAQQRFGAVHMRLHVWSLTGAPTSWPSQLRRHLGAQPVHAVLSGAGAAQWAPVEAFCEAESLPCLFPLVDRVPDTTTPRHHAVYLSEGPIAEARVAARALANLVQQPTRLHLWYASDLGQAAVTEFAAALGRSGSPEEVAGRPALLVRDLRSQPVQPGERTLSADELVVGWLDTEQVRGLFAHAIPALWLSAQMAPPESLDLPAAWRAKVRWASLHSTPDRFNAAAATGLRPWLRALGLPMDNATPQQGEVYAAAFFFTDALLRSRGAWSAEHLLERLESGVNNRAAAGRYLRLSLGQGQRIAAQVGQIQGYAHPNDRTLVPLSPIVNANR
jgi:hypothetical protein